jgi:hypothetical protein
MERNAKRKSWKLDPFLGHFLVFRDNVMGLGCHPMGLPIFMPILYIYRCLGHIERVWMIYLCDVG